MNECDEERESTNEEQARRHCGRAAYGQSHLMEGGNVEVSVDSRKGDAVQVKQSVLRRAGGVPLS